jgi:arsenate reductase (thioredoxin)
MMPASFSKCKARAQSGSVSTEAIAVMRELGVDISGHRSKHVNEFEGQNFDYVITVCDNARKSCPVFFGEAQMLHQNFQDPGAFAGPVEERVTEFRRIRDELRSYLREFARTGR